MAALDINAVDPPFEREANCSQENVVDGAIPL
jgi:hypothetical protein